MPKEYTILKRGKVIDTMTVDLPEALETLACWAASQAYRDTETLQLSRLSDDRHWKARVVSTSQIVIWETNTPPGRLVPVRVSYRVSADKATAVCIGENVLLWKKEIPQKV